MITSNEKKMGIYIHIPFCIKKCLYCDFLSYEDDEFDRKKYVNVLVSEISGQPELYQRLRVDTIYIGGGTPSLLDASDIEKILGAIKGNYNVNKEIECSIECNPGTVTLDKLKGFRKAGVNRISFGLQSAIDSELAELGRIHTYDDFVQSYEWAREAGFQNINIDLMTGIPGQTLESLAKTMENAIDLKPEHMSIYNLTLEPETPFYRKYNDAPYMDEFENYELYCQAREWMKKVDIDRYEISNYAKPGYECQHNLKYWSGQSYLGFGLGASSVVDNAQWKKTDDLYEYLRMPHVRKDLKWLDKSERMENYIIFGLRKVKGISFKEFHNIFGIDLNVMFDKQINKYYNERLMITDGRRLYLTEKGCDVSNVILQDFLM